MSIRIRNSLSTPSQKYITRLRTKCFSPFDWNRKTIRPMKPVLTGIDPGSLNWTDTSSKLSILLMMILMTITIVGHFFWGFLVGFWGFSNVYKSTDMTLESFFTKCNTRCETNNCSVAQRLRSVLYGVDFFV